MQQAARQAARLHKELQLMQSDPPPGACVWPSEDSLNRLHAQIQGPDDTVYADGMFHLEIQIPERYPFEPPCMRFKTPIYHPNIDNGGRICLDLLNMPPKGSWKPSLNISTLLISIRLLLSEPNPDDGLMTDITAEYKHNRAAFDAKARQWTEEHAIRRHEEGSQQNEIDEAPETQKEDSEKKLLAELCSTSQAQRTQLRASRKLSVRRKTEATHTDTSEGTSKYSIGSASLKDGEIVLVPDSGSEDDDEIPAHTRGKLLQQSLTLKRKANCK